MSSEGSACRRAPWWLAAAIVGFLIGRNTSSLQPAQPPPCASTSSVTSHDPVAKEASLQATIDGLRAKIVELETEGAKKNCNNTNATNVPEPTTQGEEGVIFDEAWIADPNRVMKTINSMCKVVVDNNKGSSRKLAIGTVMFCYTHVLVYRRNYDYAWENVESNGGGVKYYTGVDIPPYQMDILQYFSILLTMASIPSKPMKVEMESKGATFQDKEAGSYYKSGDGLQGPRVLFWGCGADTPLHAHVMEYLGGTITFIDNSEQYIETCKQSHPDIRLIQPTGVPSNHTRLVKDLVPPDGSGLETDDVNDPLTATEWMPSIDGVDEEEPWDIIVVDGPGLDLGRSQPLYMAKRLAQSYGPHHYTHIFLHDASRAANIVLANGIMGHDPATYIGNILPRKGLKHWRIPGRNRKLPPTTKGGGNATSRA